MGFTPSQLAPFGIAPADLSGSGQVSALATSRGFTYMPALSSGLSVYFSGGSIASATGAPISVAAGSVTLPASATSYVGFDLFDFAYRALPRAIDTAFIPVAVVVTGPSSVTSVTPLAAPVMPASRLAKTKARLMAGVSVRGILFGTSITKGTGAPAADLWTALCFDPAQAVKGYNIPGAATATITNWGSGGANAMHGMASLAQLVAMPSTQIAHPSAAWIPTIPQILRGGITSRPLSNVFTRSLPDFVCIEFGTNAFGLARDSDLVETIIRWWRERGVDVLFITGNSRTDATTAFIESSASILAISESTGCAIADTQAEMAQAIALGLTVRADPVHPNDAGQLLWARPVRRNINTVAQRAEEIAPGRYKVFRPTVSTQVIRAPNDCIYCPFQGLSGGATAVAAGTPPNYNVTLAGIASGSAVADMPVGGRANFATHAAAGIFLVYELATGHTATVKIGSAAGDIKTGIVLQGATDLLCTVEILTWAELEAIDGAFQPSSEREFAQAIAARLEVTALSGATSLRVQGFLFLAWQSRDIDFFSHASLIGTWAEEASRDDASIAVKYTDTLNDEFVLEFDSDALQITLQTGSAAGSGAKFSAWVDDELVINDGFVYPFITGGSGTLTRNVFLIPRNTGAASGQYYAGRTVRKHVARVRLTTLGSTPGAAQNRNLAVLSVRERNFA